MAHTDSSTGWENLYRIGGAAAALMAVFIPVQIVVFLLWPPPTTVAGWFALFEQNGLIGLLDLDLLLIVDQVLVALILLALYVALRRANPSFMTIALAFGAIGIASYFASTVAFEMLSLSREYAAAPRSSPRTTLLAAGQVMMATWQGTAFDAGYVLEGLALLIVALVMRQTGLFGKAAAYVGIWLGVMSLVPPTVGPVGMVFALGSLVPLEIWDILVARRLFQMAGE